MGFPARLVNEIQGAINDETFMDEPVRERSTPSFPTGPGKRVGTSSDVEMKAEPKIEHEKEKDEEMKDVSC